MPSETFKRQVADWIVVTCLLHGSSIGTAYTVAGAFITGLDRDGWREPGETQKAWKDLRRFR